MSDKALVYIRVSDQEQVDNGKSLIVQENLANKFCKANNLIIKKVYRDEGKSGTSLKGRDGINSLIADIEGGETIVFYNNKRKARNIKDAAELTDKIRERGCKIYYTETGQYEKYASPTDTLQNGLNSVIAEYESQHMGNTVSKIMLDMSERGVLIKKPSYGESRPDTAKQGTPFVECPKEWRGINRMFELKEQDNSISYRRMAKILDHEKIPTKTGKGGWYGNAVKVVMERNKEKYLNKKKEEEKRRWKSLGKEEEVDDEEELEKQMAELLLKKKLLKEKKIEKDGNTIEKKEN